MIQGHRDGHGFVTRDDGEADIYLPPNEMRAVLHKDRVKVRIVRHDRKGRSEGRVVEIIERPPQPIIGRLLHESGVWLVAPEDKRYGQDVLIPKGATGLGKPGQVVVVELTEPPSLYGQPVGRVKEVLGEIDDPGMEIEIAVRKYGVPHEFSDACIALARTLPDKVRPQDKKHRVDLTDVPLVTIDGEDARDFDDAVYCEPAKVGRGKGWRLLVAIADVSHYVETGNAIDIDAYERATSVYFPRRVIPMLPEALSNELCSLRPNVDRLCMVCDMKVSAVGHITDFGFYAAVMNSKARLTYTEVAAQLPALETAKPKAGSIDASLKTLHTLYKLFREVRERRGALDFEGQEAVFSFNEDGSVASIRPAVRNDAHKLIEEMMLAANVCTAQYLARAKQPLLYRVHDVPLPEKLAALRETLSLRGLTLGGGERPSPKDYAVLIEREGQLDEAATHYRKAIENKSDYRAAHFALGRILVNQDKFAEAIAEFQQTLTPEDDETPRNYYALGATYIRAGDKAKGVQHLREALKRARALQQTQLMNSLERDLKSLDQ